MAVLTTSDAATVPLAGERALAGQPTIAPSWVNRLIARVDRLPGPSLAWYAAAATIGALGASALGWVSGAVPAGTVSPQQAYYGALPIALLWTIHHLDGTARRALETFRPALVLDDQGYDRLRDELTIVPRRGVWIVTLLMIPFTLGYYAADPVGTGVAGITTLALAVRAVNETLVSILFVVLIYHTLRQLGAVARIHAQATRVDLFEPAPLYAFSRLTSRTAILILLLAFSSVAVDPSSWTSMSPVFSVSWSAAVLAVAIAAFTLPLMGMHERIAVEKRRLESEAGRRLTEVIATLHAAVDSGDLGQADGLNKLLASLMAERDLVGRLRTWPWQPGTIGAVASAIVLPIVLFLATRLLERLV